MQQWKQSVEQQLASVTQAVSACQVPAPALLQAAVLPPAHGPKTPHSTDVSFPDSGFQSTGEQQALQEDSFLSSGTADSLKTVRALSPVDGAASADCSLLEQYLSSVQQREQEDEEAVSDRTETPQPSSPASPSKTAQPQSPQQEAQRTEDTTPGPV